MPRILLIKTSSLGDVVHNLPVVTDLAAEFPGAIVDWVVEEAFAAIPLLHPGVAQVLPVAIRRWRRTPWRPGVWREGRMFVSALRARQYDAVIDTQGLLKSAWIARAARGVRHGLDRASSREPLGCFYDRTYAVSWHQHAVERNRSLAAHAMGYVVSGPACYGIRAEVQGFDWLTPDRPHAVLLHATSAERKLWPEACWIDLGCQLAAQAMTCVLPWGNADEHERSVRLARHIPQAVVPVRLELPSLASLLTQARIVIGTDTGLTHLAGALGTPTVGIYCATDPAATGLHGGTNSVNLGDIGAVPDIGEVLAAATRLLR